MLEVVHTAVHCRFVEDAPSAQVRTLSFRADEARLLELQERAYAVLEEAVIEADAEVEGKAASAAGAVLIVTGAAADPRLR